MSAAQPIPRRRVTPPEPPHDELAERRARRALANLGEPARVIVPSEPVSLPVYRAAKHLRTHGG